jgi:hypothetical protein
MTHCFRFMLCWVVALMQGCAIYAPQYYAGKQTFAERFEGLPRKVDMVEVPFIPQDSFYCGPASLSSVLTYLGKDASFDELESELVLPARRGTLQLDMLVVARKRGVVPHVLAPQLDDLIRTLAMGYPVIALENFGSALFPLWHYSVIVGYDLDTGHLFRRSGMREYTRIPIPVFEYLWADDGHWAMTVLPTHVTPIQPKQTLWRDQLLQMEKDLQPAQALVAWSTFSKAFPQDPLGWAAQGNALANQQDWTPAAQRYEQALTLAPDHVRMAKTGAEIFGRAGLEGQAECARRVAGQAAKWPCQ